MGRMESTKHEPARQRLLIIIIVGGNRSANGSESRLCLRWMMWEKGGRINHPWNALGAEGGHCRMKSEDSAP